MCDCVWQYVFAMIVPFFVSVFLLLFVLFLLAWSHDIAGHAWLVFLFLRSFYSFMLIVIHIGMLRCKATEVCGCVYSLCVAGFTDLIVGFSFCGWSVCICLLCCLIWDLCVWFRCRFIFLLPTAWVISTCGGFFLFRIPLVFVCFIHQQNPALCWKLDEQHDSFTSSCLCFISFLFLYICRLLVVCYVVAFVPRVFLPFSSFFLVHW